MLKVKPMQDDELAEVRERATAPTANSFDFMEVERLLARYDAEVAKVSILQTANDNIAAALHEVEDQRDAAEAERDRLDAECEQLADQCDDLEIKLEDLQAVVDKLPKCWRLNEDGKLVQDCPVVRGMELFRVDPFTNEVFSIGKVFSMTVGINHATDDEADWYVVGQRQFNVSSCYDTRAAAEAARNHSATEDDTQ